MVYGDEVHRWYRRSVVRFGKRILDVFSRVLSKRKIHEKGMSIGKRSIGQCYSIESRFNHSCVWILICFLLLQIFVVLECVFFIGEIIPLCITYCTTSLIFEITIYKKRGMFTRRKMRGESNLISSIVERREHHEQLVCMSFSSNHCVLDARVPMLHVHRNELYHNND